MSAVGHSRRFGRRPTTSDVPPETDIVTAGPHVSKVPTPEVGYSITLSALASSGIGTVSPSALAAFRLIDNSNLES
jgi:hypothetical protein